MTAFGEKIRELRKAKGYTLEKLAELTELSKSYIWELENKNPSPPVGREIGVHRARIGRYSRISARPNAKLGVVDATDEAFYRKYRPHGCHHQRPYSPHDRGLGRRQMTGPSPVRWAIDLSLLLNTVLGLDRFPVDVPLVAKEYSLQRYPEDPISVVIGDNLPGFDGALYRAPAGKKGWGIFYNDSIASKGRMNFTLAHEFGHYLMHREAYPNGLRCGEQDVVRWDSEYGQVEHQANLFAANLLMPLDDYRRQIGAADKVDLDMIAHCADRYRVSLIAAVLRWLEYTSRRAVLVVSRDGYILWARSSEAALKTGAYFRTSAGPIEIPVASLAARRDGLVDGRSGVDVEAGVWFREPVREMTIFAEQYDFAVTLLLLSNEVRYFADAESEMDTYERFMQRS